MKLRIAGIFLLLASSSLLIIGCPGKNSPSSPAAPADTNTPTSTPTNQNGFTSTPSYTPTASFTPTATNAGGFTSTPSSFTPTYTSTLSYTPTFTYTYTSTSTPTNTFTSTFTATSTATNTVCMDGSGHTCTFTYTPAAPTNTSTLCPTQSFTPTPGANGYSISGTVDYTGESGTVSGTNPIEVVAFQQGSGNGGNYYLVTSNGGSYTIQGLSSGSAYLLVAVYNSSVTGFNWPPAVGSSAELYGTTTCNTSSASQVTVTGNLTGYTLSFGDSNQLSGYGGTVTYSGSMGRVDGCHQIAVLTYPTSTTLYGSSGVTNTSNNQSSEINTNGGSFNMVGGNGGSSPCATQTMNVLAFYVVPGSSCCTIQPGDPYVWQTNVSTSTSPSLNLTISDSQTY